MYIVSRQKISNKFEYLQDIHFIKIFLISNNNIQMLFDALSQISINY